MADFSQTVERDVLDGIPGFVLRMTPGGEIEHLNRQIQAYLGEAAVVLEHWPSSEVVPLEDLPRASEAFAAALVAGTPFEVEHRLRRFDGLRRWFRCRGQSVRDSQGSVDRWYLLLTDIEETKQAEQALDKTHAELAHVTRVTSLGILTASIAHELNQPLSGIVTNASTCLRMLAADPPNLVGARETARRSIRDGIRAAEMTARLHALFSKKARIDEAVDLNEAAREALQLSANDLQKNRVLVQQALAEDLPLVTGDRLQFQQVIQNLLLNASDAMSTVDDRPRQLVIRTERDEGDRVRLTVEDSGIGFEASDADKLFEAFYTTKAAGMGIGLSVSRTIIESYAGRLWAALNEGPGAVFAFSVRCQS